MSTTQEKLEMAMAGGKSAAIIAKLKKQLDAEIEMAAHERSLKSGRVLLAEQSVRDAWANEIIEANKVIDESIPVLTDAGDKARALLTEALELLGSQEVAAVSFACGGALQDLAYRGTSRYQEAEAATEGIDKLIYDLDQLDGASCFSGIGFGIVNKKSTSEALLKRINDARETAERVKS